MEGDFAGGLKEIIDLIFIFDLDKPHRLFEKNSFAGKDFSFLGALLKWAGVVALLLIVAAVFFGFQLGAIFSVAMIALAGGAILLERIGHRRGSVAVFCARV